MADASDGIDYFVVVSIPPWVPEEPIGSFRRAYDPTAELIPPHITLVFPIPLPVGLDPFLDHVRDVLSHTSPFEVRLRGLEKSWDHYLFLMVAEGRDAVIALHDALYTGILRPYLWSEHAFAPHVGLGLFVQEGDAHDLLELRPRALDEPLFERALDEARALNLDYRGRIDTVQILGMDEQLTCISRLAELPLR